MDLREYIAARSIRGDCQCGKCIASAENVYEMPTEHTEDLVFFKVANNPDNPATADELRELIKAHRGEFCSVDLFDGLQHGLQEVGGFVGDQGLALQLMGIGSLLGLWNLITPMLLGIDGPAAMALAGDGLLGILAEKK